MLYREAAAFWIARRQIVPKLSSVGTTARWCALAMAAVGSVNGCATGGVADYLATFYISGHSVDARSGAPLEGSGVDFLDTGLDPWRSRDPIRIRVGQSGPGGVIGLSLQYLWGEKVGLFLTEADGSLSGKTARIIISHPGYRERDFEFHLGKLERSNGILNVELGRVELQPLSNAESGKS